jgi:hypothetical protein
MLAKWRPKLIKKTPKWKKSQHEPWNVPITFFNSWICFKSCAILYPAHDKKPKKEDKKNFVINSCYQLLNIYYKNTFYCCPSCILDIVSHFALQANWTCTQTTICMFFYLFWVVLFYPMFHVEEKKKLKNELVLSKCMNYESWSMKVSRLCMKAWRIQFLQQMSLLVNFTKQNFKNFLLFLVNCKTRSTFMICLQFFNYIYKSI